jgi:hypothetical protein
VNAISIGSPQHTEGSLEPPPGIKPAPPTAQDSPAGQAMQPQLEALLATQPMPGQQLSPRLPPMPNMPGTGSAQARPAPAHVQLPALQSGALPPHTVPHAPQFMGSDAVLMQVPPQHDCPAPQREPVEPHAQVPPEQTSPSAHALPSEPQFRGLVDRFTHWKRPPSFTQTSPSTHSPKSPHAHSGELAPARTLHEMARSGSHASPHPLQLLKGERGSVALVGRPSTFAGCVRSTQLVPQQRWLDAHVGLHEPGGTLASLLGPVEHTPAPHVPEQTMPQPPQLLTSIWVNTQRPSQQVCEVAQGSAHPPLPRPPPAQPATNANIPATRNPVRRDITDPSALEPLFARPRQSSRARLQEKGSAKASRVQSEATHRNRG